MAKDFALSTVLNAVSVAAGTATSAHQHDRATQYAVVMTTANDSPATKNFLDTAITTTGDYINISAHGYQTGLLGTLTTTSALPTGLANNVNYYVIRRDAGSIQLATSRANAAAGTAITLAKDGNGTHSFKPTAIAGLDYHLQWSIDGQTYFPISGSTCTTVGTTGTTYGPVGYNYLRMNCTLTAGQITGTVTIRSIE